MFRHFCCKMFFPIFNWNVPYFSCAYFLLSYLLSCGAQNWTQQPDVFHHHWFEGKDHVLGPGGNVLIHQDTKVFHCWASFQLAVPQQLLPHRITPIQVQHSALLCWTSWDFCEVLSESLWMAVPGVSKTPPSLVSTAKLHRVHSHPLSTSVRGLSSSGLSIPEGQPYQERLRPKMCWVPWPLPRPSADPLAHSAEGLHLPQVFTRCDLVFPPRISIPVL